MSSEPKPEVVSSAAYHADTDDEQDVKTSSRSAMMDYDADTDQEDFAPTSSAGNEDINKALTSTTHNADKDGGVAFKISTDEKFTASPASTEQFTYTGQSRSDIPKHITRVLIDGSIDTVPSMTFYDHPNIEEVICHVNIKRIAGCAFQCCRRLRRVVMPGVTDVEEEAFHDCPVLADVECGMLEMIEEAAFAHCESLSKFDLSSVRIVRAYAFLNCKALTSASFSRELEQIYGLAFANCTSLEQITAPFAVISSWSANSCVVMGCEMLKHVNLVEEEALRETVAALQLEDWRDDINKEFDAISKILPNKAAGYYRDDDDYDDEEKTQAICRWIEQVREKLASYNIEA